MPGFDPNEPRDAIGRWTSTIKSALQTAASDLPKETEQQKKVVEDTAVTALTEQSVSTATGIPLKQIRLDGLTPAENMDVLTVFKDEIGKNGLTPAMMHEGIKTYGAGAGEGEVLPSLNPNQTALAAYVYNPHDKVGGFELYLDTIHSGKNDLYKAESWDEKINNIEDGIKKSEEDFNKADEFIRLMNQDSFDKWKREANRKIQHYKEWKAQGRESKPYTISNSFQDKDKRFEAMMYHELGHMRLREYYTNTHHTNARSDTPYEKWKTVAMGAEMKNNPISDYGDSSSDEYFAENYSAFKMGLPVSEGMKKFIKSLNLN